MQLVTKILRLSFFVMGNEYPHLSSNNRKMKGDVHLDEVIGYLVVVGFVTLLSFELIRQIREYNASKQNKSRRVKRIMIFSLFSFIFCFSLNVLVGSGVVENGLISSNSTALGALLSLVVHFIVKFRYDNKQEKIQQFQLRNL